MESGPSISQPSHSTLNETSLETVEKTEAAGKAVLYKRMLLKNSQILQENTCIGVCPLIKLHTSTPFL